jgi:hypothetical protein
MLALRDNAKPIAVRPSRQEVARLHKSIPALYQRLFKERFGTEAYPWDGNDTSYLDKSVFSLFAHSWTVEKVEQLVRDYFDSDGILPGRPYEWLPTLHRYSCGALGANGITKSTLAELAAEDAKKRAEIFAEVARRETAIAEADGELLRSRLLAKVTSDLRFRGFEVFISVGLSYVIAIRKNISARNAPALRIVCRNSENEVTKNADFYQAVVVSPDQDVRVNPVDYFPPLTD